MDKTIVILARWESAGEKWRAVLERDAAGFTLREYKRERGEYRPCGASYRPRGFYARPPFNGQTLETQTRHAISAAEVHVLNSFDVAMIRKPIP